MNIDYIIPFVDGSDIEFQKVYNKYSPTSKREARSRDWDVLKYQLRSIEKFLPWINKIYIVLSIGETQIPKWLNINNEKIKIVWDWEIVPKGALPTFNSNTIELYFPKIEGLSEHYLTACDDYLITKPMQKEDFFTEDGKAKLRICRGKFKRSIYSMSVFNSVRMFNLPIEHKRGINNIMYYYCAWADHTITPHLKSYNLKFLEEHERKIRNSLTMFRTPMNLTWLIYPLNLRKQGMLVGSTIKGKTSKIFKDEDIEAIDLNIADVVVINDSYKGEDWLNAKEILREKMNSVLPNKSEFELCGSF